MYLIFNPELGRIAISIASPASEDVNSIWGFRVSW